MKIGITGASGMLGSSLTMLLSKKNEIFATSRNRGLEGKNIEWNCFDLTDTVTLSNWLHKGKFDVVIHCAAIVNVDVCEDNPDDAIALHIRATEVIKNYLNSNGGRLIYISTDSVFDGEKQGSYCESHSTNPLNVYAKTKLAGEKLIQEMDNGLVLRTNIIGWIHNDGSSFAEWVLKGLTNNMPLSLFHDVYFSPLHVDDLSLIIEKIIKKPVFGLYHCAGKESISKYDFGMKMAEIFHLDSESINRVSVDNMVFKASRPKNMALNSSRLSDKLRCTIPSAKGAVISMKRQYDSKQFMKKINK